MEVTKMQLLHNPTSNSYADIKNARFSKSEDHVISIQQRWQDTYNNLPHYMQERVDYMLESAKQEFKRRNPGYKKWKDLPLAEAKNSTIEKVHIDATMQRQLDISWVCYLLTTFSATKVVPIQVYRYDDERLLAWDGQHTLVLLWLIATQIFEEDPGSCVLPVNVYQSSLKSEMRENYVSLNTNDGKKQFDPFDTFEQKVYGVRVDGSQHSTWLEAEKKQKIIEAHGLFVTAKKFGDEEEAGAITRLQEINKLDAETLENLIKYLAMVGANQRPTVEKELVMMANFFERCKFANISVDNAYIADIANAALTHWNADFSPNGKFWTRASNAYYNWHRQYSFSDRARFNKEPVHGGPFLSMQLKKCCPHLDIPKSNSKSEFTPLEGDLF
jgi:hypothetical protein